MLLRTLGQLALLDDGVPVLARRRKTLVILAFLAHRPGIAVPRDLLAAVGWATADRARARHSLRQALAELRAALPHSLDITAESVRLHADAIAVDADRFLAASREGRHGDAVAAWQGEFLAGMQEGAPSGLAAWISTVRATHAEALATSVAAATHAALDAGRWAEARRLAAWWCTAAPCPAAEALAGEVHAATRGSGASGLVGRDDEMAILFRLWREAQAGHARIVALTGGAGSGKSRLLAEFAQLVRARPGAAFVRALAPGSGPAARQHAIRELRPTAGRAMLVLLDDAAPDEAEEMHALIEAVPAHMLVVVAGRPDALAGTPLYRPVRDTRLEHIALEGISTDAARMLVREVVPLEAKQAQALADRVHADTAGHPGVMLSLLADLRAEGLIAEGEDGRLALARGLPRGPIPMPLDRVERTRRRLERMTAQARRVAEALAVLATPQAEADVASVSGLAPDACHQALRECLERRLARRDETGRLSLYGPALVAPVYDLLPGDRRRAMHRRAARVVGRQARRNRALRPAVRAHRRAGRPDWATAWLGAARRRVAAAGAFMRESASPSSAPSSPGR